MKKAIWNAQFSGLFVRLPLGLYFCLAGYLKLQNFEPFVETVRSFHLLPDQLAVLYGVMLPWIEIGTGVLLIFGLWTIIAASVASMLLLTFVLALGIFPTNPKLFNKDIILLFASLSLLASGGGAWSIDKFRENG